MERLGARASCNRRTEPTAAGAGAVQWQQPIPDSLWSQDRFGRRGVEATRTQATKIDQLARGQCLPAGIELPASAPDRLWHCWPPG